MARYENLVDIGVVLGEPALEGLGQGLEFRVMGGEVREIEAVHRLVGASEHYCEGLLAPNHAGQHEGVRFGLVVEQGLIRAVGCIEAVDERVLERAEVAEIARLQPELHRRHGMPAPLHRVSGDVAHIGALHIVLIGSSVIGERLRLMVTFLGPVDLVGQASHFRDDADLDALELAELGRIPDSALEIHLLDVDGLQRDAGALDGGLRALPVPVKPHRELVIGRGAREQQLVAL